MRKDMVFAFCGVVLLAVACSSSGRWQKAGRFDSSAFPVAEDRFVIKYNGSSGMTAGVIREQLLYRAAELTLRRGFTHFTLNDHSAMPSTYGSARDVLGYSVGATRADLLDPCGPEVQEGGGLTAFYGATAVVQMLNNPAAAPRAMDARRLIMELQAKRQQVELAPR